MARAPASCPCCSGRTYTECCAPFHRGEREAPDPEALMRSRFAAFARGEVAYLVRTLDRDHELRAAPVDRIAREVREATRAFRYMALTVLDHSAPGPDGIAEVLFHARVFQRGRDRSFVERSQFRHDGTGWRYLSGDTKAASELSGDPRALTLRTFGARD